MNCCTLALGSWTICGGAPPANCVVSLSTKSASGTLVNAILLLPLPFSKVSIIDLYQSLMPGSSCCHEGHCRVTLLAAGVCAAGLAGADVGAAAGALVGAAAGAVVGAAA